MMGNDAASRWVAFTPRDTVLVRDGRSFNAGPGPGPASRAGVVSPWPSTVAGATTSAFAGSGSGSAGGAGTGEPDQVRGPVLGLKRGAEWRAYFPTPGDLVLPEGEEHRREPRVRRLVPVTLSAGGSPVETDLDDAPLRWMVPPAGAGTVRALQSVISVDAMTRYLADALDDPTPLAGLSWIDPLSGRAPLVAEPRVGLAREGRAAREGFLYAATHLRPRDGWGFLVECVDSAGTREVTPRSPVPLGGKARLADVEPATGAAWPAAPATFPGGRVLVYVATPALWGGWRPPLPDGVRLIAACVQDPVTVATSSVRRARAMRETGEGRGSLLDTAVLRWAVPAGSVYLLQFDDGPVPGAEGVQPAEVRAQRWAQAMHGVALGPAHHLDRDGVPIGSALDGPGSRGTDRTATAGFGVVLVGRWGSHREDHELSRTGEDDR